MKLLRILIIFIFIQFILTADTPEKTEEEIKKEEEEKIKEENEKCNILKDEKSSFEICKGVTFSKSKKSCCFFSFVSGAKRVNMCFAIEKDEYKIQQFLNSLESNKVTTDSMTSDDASMKCFSNINKYKYKIFFILLFML